jgi:hypothetical protein
MGSKASCKLVPKLMVSARRVRRSMRLPNAIRCKGQERGTTSVWCRASSERLSLTRRSWTAATPANEQDAGDVGGLYLAY